MRFLALMILAASVAAAQDEKQDEKDARLEAISKLKGEWIMEGQDEPSLVYKVTSGGSTVMETLFAGTKNEMITMYHMDKKDFVLTHYCMVGNQPKMKAAKKIKDKVLTFSCAGVSNAESHDDGHMHALKMTFVDDDTIIQEWTFHQEGKDAPPKKMTFKRKTE